MRMVKIESGGDKGKSAITMNDEPKIKRPGPEPITTRNTPVKTRAERDAARAAARAAKNEKA